MADSDCPLWMRAGSRWARRAKANVSVQLSLEICQLPQSERSKEVQLAVLTVVADLPVAVKFPGDQVGLLAGLQKLSCGGSRGSQFVVLGVERAPCQLKGRHRTDFPPDHWAQADWSHDEEAMREAIRHVLASTVRFERSAKLSHKQQAASVLGQRTGQPESQTSPAASAERC